MYSYCSAFNHITLCFFGYLIAQHMIRMRWEDLTVDERRQMASMACDLLQESARPNEPWVLKSQVAALMAEVSK